MSKFKVGDRVRVRKDLKINEVYGGLVFIRDMQRYRGHEFTVKGIDRDGDCLLRDANDFWFSSEMLELAAEGFNDVYYDGALGCWFIHVGDMTICTKDFGMAKKHPDDEYCKEIGQALAYKRFMEV